MSKLERIDNILIQLRALQTPETQFVFVNHPAVQEAACYLGLRILDPLPPQWAYYHIVTKQGGVIPASVQGLINLLEKEKCSINPIA